MKSTVSIFLVLAVFTACESVLLEDVDVPDYKEMAQTKSTMLTLNENEPAVVKDLRNYISQVKSHAKHTRSSFNYTLTPFQYNGDTVMYIANYGDGWELLSTDHRVPLVIASSETGKFNLTDSLSMNQTMWTYIKCIADELHFIKQIEDNGLDSYGLWKTISLSNNEVIADSISINPKMLSEYSKNVSLQPGDGYWELLSTTPPNTTTKESPDHIIKTKWGQENLWNRYVPYKSGNSGDRSPAGCTAIAGAQFLYYLHYKNNRPESTVTDAIYDSQTNTYTYTGSSSTVWDQMARTIYDFSGHSQTAVFIGHVGKSINMNYGLNESTASLADLAAFINKSGYNYIRVPIDYTYIQDKLLFNEPVIVAGYVSKYEGHSFIIDQYRDTKTTTTSTFGWVGTDNLGNDSNERDPEGNIIGYTFTYTRENVQSRSFKIRMNWGADGDYDDIWYDCSSSADWNVPNNASYNQRREMLR